MSKRKKLARLLQAPMRGIKNWIAPRERADVENPLRLTDEQMNHLQKAFEATSVSLRSLEPAIEQMAIAMTRTQARRAEKARFVVYGRPHQAIDGFAVVTAEMLAGDWDMSHRPAPEPAAPEDPEVWARRVSAAGDIIEEHRVATGRDLSGYEELFAAPMIETKDVGGDEPQGPVITIRLADGVYVDFGRTMQQIEAEIDRAFIHGAGVGRPHRILVTSQPDPKRNGVYTGKSGKWFALDESDEQEPIKKGPIWPAYD